jgi:ribose transport system permease protein
MHSSPRSETMVLVRGVVFLITAGAPVGDEGLPSSFVAFGSERFLGIHYLVWVPAVLLVLLSWVMHNTPHGRRIYAVGGGRDASYLSGIPVQRVIASTYVWCGTLAGIAGVMLAARLQSGQPTAGEFYELTAIAAVVLGGAALHGGEGTLYKSVIGVFIMVVLGNSLNLLNVDSYWQRVAVGAGHHCGSRSRSATMAPLARGEADVENAPGSLGRAGPARGSDNVRATDAGPVREDHHRRGARPRRQPALYPHAEGHSRAGAGARVGGGDGLLQRGQAQADQWVQDLIARGVKAVLISPIDAVGVNAAYDAAAQAKIPIISLARGSSSPNQTLHVGINEKQIGREIAEWTAKQIGGQGKVAMLVGQAAPLPSATWPKATPRPWRSFQASRSCSGPRVRCRANAASSMRRMHWLPIRT